jgi:hypothetical protein
MTPGDRDSDDKLVESAAKLLRMVLGWPVRVGRGARSGQMMAVAERLEPTRVVFEAKDGKIVSRAIPLRVVLYVDETDLEPRP